MSRWEPDVARDGISAKRLNENYDFRVFMDVVRDRLERAKATALLGRLDSHEAYVAVQAEYATLHWVVELSSELSREHDEQSQGESE